MPTVGKSPGRLDARRRRFVEEYLLDLNGAAAYRRAGFRAKNNTVASANATRLLKEPAVAKAIEKAKVKRSERTEIGQDYVVTKLVEIVELAPDELRRKRGKLADQVAALRLLGLHNNMFKERHEHTGKDGGPIELMRLTEEAVELANRADD